MKTCLEFALKCSSSKFIYYSKDNAFGDFLLKEFEEVNGFEFAIEGD